MIEPEVLDSLGDNTCTDFPEVIEHNRRSGGRIGIYPISENSWLDMGQLDELEKMRRRLGVDE